MKIKSKPPNISKYATNSNSDDSDDNVPLAKLNCRIEEPNSEPSSSEVDDSDADPEFKPGICEARRCKDEIWAACHKCETMLCYDHFLEEKPSCPDHGKKTSKKKVRRNKVKHATCNLAKQIQYIRS